LPSGGKKEKDIYMLDTASLPDKAPDFDLLALLEAGAHFGHQKAKWSPKMAPYIYMEKDGVHIFDLEKTAAQLQVAYNFAYQLGKQGKTMIVVGTKRQAQEIVREAGATHKVMHITSRWLGGLLTNWDQVRLSIKRMNEIEKGLQTDAYKGYTKYEKVQLEKEMNRLNRFFGGVKELQGKPDCLFIIDPKREKNAVKEANIMGVPVIAMIDSNADPDLVDVAIPANDDAVKSIQYIVDAVIAGYQAGRKDK
jgi:small subunit ribosomal protein S2